MKILALAAIAAGLSGRDFSAAHAEMLQSKSKPHKPTAKNKPSKNRWRRSEPSPYFGRRSKVVTAITNKGPQKMKLKTALKKEFKFNF